MFEKLITQYGVLMPLIPEDYGMLRLNLSAFEDSSGLLLAPFLLDAVFLDHLRDKILMVEASDNSMDGEESLLWALVHNSEMIVGFFDISVSPEDRSSVVLNWTINPDWKDSPFTHEALYMLVGQLFEKNGFRCIRADRQARCCPEMDQNFRRLGFLAYGGNESTDYYLSKPVEGRLL